MRKSVSKKSAAKKKTKKVMKKKSAAKKRPATKKTVTKKEATKSSSKVDFAVIEEYLEFMEARGLSELEYSVPSLAIKLKRGSGAATAPAVVAPAPVASAATSNDSAEASDAASHIVKSPFVGTFYRSPGPNQEPFIEEGKTVGSGDVLCIVEAMKLMNEIESDIKGRIKRVLVKDATPVEFGEALFEIDPL